MRRMDLLAPGNDGIYGGVPLFMDVTIVSPVHGTGLPMPRSHTQEGAALQRAENRNRTVDYPDVEASPLAQLLSLGVETYGRWSEHSLTLIRHLAKYKSNNVPPYLKRSVEQGSYVRWWSLLSVGVQQIVADSILRPAGSDLSFASSNNAQVPITEFLC